MTKWLSTCSKIAIFVAVGITAPMIASAQDGGEESGSTPVEDAVSVQDTIIVTTRGRGENIQDVPLAISAFDEEALQRKNIQELEDVARFTSGFSFEDFSSGFAAPVIRGQAQTRVTAIESNVSTFWDGVYIPRSWGVDVGTAGVNRIEIVKGPQSARYGRNAFAGAINYVPKKATLSGDGFSGDAGVTVGSDERFDIGAYINFAASDQFAIAGSYTVSEFDGSFTNGHPFADLGLDPGTNGKVGGWDNTSASISAIFEPTDNLSFEAAYYNTEISNEARASRYLSPQTGDTNCGELLFGVFPSLICGELPEAQGIAINDPRGFGTQSDTDIFRLSAKYDFNDNVSASYIYGKVEGDVNIGNGGEPDPINCGTLVGPPTFAALCNFQITPVGDIDYDSHEIRLDIDTGGSVTGAIGGFISEGQDNNTFTSVNIAPVTDPNNFAPLVGTPVPSFVFNPGPFNLLLGDVTTDTEVASIFGELNWTSADGGTRAGVEARYSETEISALNNSNMDTFNETFSVFTPRFTLERDLNEDQLIYGSIARGAKAGGFNPSATNASDQTFDEETNWTFELGGNYQFMDGRFTLNGALFYVDWSDVQINGANPAAADPQNATSIVTNLGNVTVFGFEADALFQATENLSFDATFSYADSTYDDGTIDNRFVRGAQCDDIVCAADGDIGGNEVERTPPTQFSLGAQWENSINADWDYYLRGDLSHQSEFYVSSANIATIPDRTLVNLRAGVTYGDVEVSIWGRNVTDEVYVSNAFAVFLPFGNTYGAFYGERSTYGLSASVRY